MENKNPKIVEVTHPQPKTDVTETVKTTLPADTEDNNSKTVNDDLLLRAIADAGMDLLKQVAKERVNKLISDLQQKGNLNTNEGKQALEQLQRETELARLRAEQQTPATLAQLTPAPAYKEFKKLKKKVKRLQQEVQELRAMLLLLGNNSNGKG